MIKSIFPFILSVFLAASCKKSADDNLEEQVPVGTILKVGSFVSGSKSTSGTVKIVQAANNSIKLVFENLSTGNGPDVRVWLSPNTSGNPYQEVGLLKAVTGNFSYDLSSNIDYNTNNRVLIWCEDFSVLFGHAVLQ
jgi:hypothetical protein